MQTKQFLSAVLDDQGFYCVLGRRTKDKHTVQKFYDSIDSVVDSALNFDQQGYDAYFALSTFNIANSRQAENCNKLKALFLDIDCGEGKPYATQSDAITVLRGFCNNFSLPKPTAIINSGRGLHVYWGLTQSYPRSTWTPVAEKLKAACLEYGLEIDPVVTADAARILRVPDTHNFKADPPALVHLLGSLNGLAELDVFIEKLAAISIPVPSPTREFTDRDKETMEALAGTYQKSFSKIVTKTAEGKGCAQLDNAIRNSASLSYPEWVSALSIAKHCNEAQTAIHALSQNYPNYSREETEKVAASIKYPHLCTTFEANNPDLCKDCPLKGKIKSPISIGVEVREASPEDNVVKIVKEPSSEDIEEALNKDPEVETYVIPKLPYPYFRGRGGGVYLRTKDKADEPLDIEVYRRDLYIIKRLRDPVYGPSYVFRHHTQREGVKDFTIPGISLSSREEFRKEMGRNDIFLLKADLLMNYVAAWIRELQNTQDEIEAKTQFGWTPKHKSFVVGAKEIFADHIKENPPSFATAQYFDFFDKKGTLEGWKEVAKFYKRPDFEVHQYMFALAFGSPLMEFVPNIAGGIYHITSGDSGFGKTTGQWGGASVWGNYTKLVLDGDDTTNSMWHRAEVYKNLPVYVDETTNIPPDKMSDFVYRVTAGKQRNRQTNTGQNKERFRGEPWSLLVGTSANTSMLEKIALSKTFPKGEAQRVFECRTPQLLFSSKETVLTRALNEQLVSNYGHAGEIYIQRVLRNIPQVKELLKQTTAKIIYEANLTPQNRIWAHQAGAVITGARLAKHYGLIDWDIDGLLEWVIMRLKRLKFDMKEMDICITDIIAQYYAEHIQSVLRIKSTDDARTGTGLDMLIVPEAMPRYNWVARHEYDIRKLYLMVKPFKTWCIKQQLNHSGMVELIVNELHGKKEKIRIGKGTTISLPSMNVISLTWDDEEHNDIVQAQIDVLAMEDDEIKAV